MRRYKVYLDGRSLDEIAGVVVLGVTEAAPERSVTAFPAAGADGSHAVAARRGTLSVTVSFAIKTRDIALRAQTMTEVNSWARGSVLEVNYRPGQQLRVECAQLPQVGEAHRWSDQLSMRFTAYDVPYWEAVTETETEGEGMEINARIAPPGSAETVLSARMEILEQLSNITIKANGTELDLIRLSAVEGDIIDVGHDEAGRIFLKKNEENIFYRRLASSDDEVRIECGRTNEVSVTADGKLHAKITTRGRWL